MAKKIDLSKEAVKTTAGAEEEAEVVKIDDAFLREICPKALLPAFKQAKTPAARADFLYNVENLELKKARATFKEIDNFVTKLEAWFIQEFAGDQKGVTGKVGRVEVTDKKIATVIDWTKFYKHIQKKGEFDLLNKAVNQKAVQERWEQEKTVPGVDTFTKKVISLTKVKGKK